MSTQNSVNNQRIEYIIDPGASGDSFVQYNINTIGKFKIGSDDSDSDKFKISNGSALGTNDFLILDADGLLLKPLQSAFSVYLGSSVANVTGDGTEYVVSFTELFDLNADFSTNTFTAPKTARYALTFASRVRNLSASYTTGFIKINTSNRLYYINTINCGAVQSSFNQYLFKGGALIDMDAGDIATFILKVSGSSKIVQIDGAASGSFITYATGILIC